jgi:hypothetical protein
LYRKYSGLFFDYDFSWPVSVFLHGSFRSPGVPVFLFCGHVRLPDSDTRVLHETGDFSSILGRFSRRKQIRAEQKKICIYPSIRYYETDRVMPQEKVDVKREDLCIY